MLTLGDEATGQGADLETYSYMQLGLEATPNIKAVIVLADGTTSSYVAVKYGLLVYGDAEITSGELGTGALDLQSLNTDVWGICTLFVSGDLTVSGGSLNVKSGEPAEGTGSVAIGAGGNVNLYGGTIDITVASEDTTCTNTIGIMSGYAGSGDINFGLSGKGKDSLKVTVRVYCPQNFTTASGMQAGISTSTKGSVNFNAGDYVAYVGNSDDTTTWVGSAVAAKTKINLDTESFSVTNALAGDKTYTQATKDQDLEIASRSKLVLLNTMPDGSTEETDREQIGEN